MRSKGLGFAGINDVRAGKLIELDLADGTSDADIEAMCRKLLANTVIENFTHRAAGLTMNSRGHRLPRIQLRPRPRGGDPRRSAAAPRRWCGTATASFPTGST